MIYILKTQGISIVFSLFWVLYLNIIAYFDQPGRAMEHINGYVYGFAALFFIINFFIMRTTIRGDWTSLPLVLIPELVLYQPIFLKVQNGLVHQGYRAVLQFLSSSLTTVYLLTITLAIILGILISRIKNKG